MDKFKQKTNYLSKLKTSYHYVLDTLYKPTDPASLAFARILFGVLMFLDITDERGGSYIDLKWGEPKDCYFPLFPQMKRFTLPWMCVIYGVMWIGALGISLGFKFKLSCLAFTIPYWYILLLDKSFWNNHSYLYGLVSALFLTTSANTFWSIDSFMQKKKDRRVPYWNYFILKFQFFLLYFYAGLKKTDKEWLDGYSMTNLGKHWVFTPFSILLTVNEIDYLIIHWSGFVLDLTVGFFLLYNVTRPFAMIFCSLFHIMNTRIFSIGMFPYVCLATMPLFCDPNWPVVGIRGLRMLRNAEEVKDDKNFRKEYPKKHTTVFLIALYCLLQMFLPYSHFITKGYNNWTNGLYGYSWDMMVHSWDTTLVVVRVVDNNSGKEHYLDPAAWAPNDRWSKHADMCVQYAQCLKQNLLDEVKVVKTSNEGSFVTQHITTDNVSIYFDVWCSLNGRFQQRMYDPHYDMLEARWSPFQAVEWLLPLLTEYNDLRAKMKDIQDHVYTWSNYSDVLFIADFPGLSLENYITSDLINVTLTIIEGEIYFESENYNMGIKLAKGSSIPIMSDVFHKIHTISDVPSCFMYTYTNKTKEILKEVNTNNKRANSHSPIPIFEESTDWIDKIGGMVGLITNSIMHILYNVPMVRRSHVIE